MLSPTNENFTRVLLITATSWNAQLPGYKQPLPPYFEQGVIFTSWVVRTKYMAEAESGNMPISRACIKSLTTFTDASLLYGQFAASATAEPPYNMLDETGAPFALK